MAALRIELVGGVRVRGSDGREVPLKARKSQALLACLALRPDMTSSRDFLASLLWDDADPELARSSLRQALAGLRRALPDDCSSALQADSQSVWLDVDQVASDVAEFHAQVRDGSPGALLATIDRYREELLAGIDVRSVAFEHWVQEQRGVFRRQLVQALERVAAQCSAADDLSGRLHALERLVALEPVNERAHRDLMTVLARLGRPTDALRQYRMCREALRRDLDVATEPATDALRREILRQRRVTGPADATAVEEMAAGTTLPSATTVPTLREAIVLCVRDGGFHGAGDATDPERVRQRWSALEARVRAVAERFGGRVDQVREGEVLAVFGLETLAGNEADRAARSAWELTQTAPTAKAADVVVACGIAAGQVLPVDGELPFPLTGRPVGDARELARRASAGATFATVDVASRMPAAFESVPSNGSSGSAAARLVSIAGPAVTGSPQRFVGRRAELAMLTTLLAEVANSRRARTVLVRGEPGIGKSAVAGELTRAAERQGIASHTLYVLDFGQSAVERPIPALALRLLGSTSDASPEGRAAAVARAAAEGRIPADDVLLASDLVGAAIPEAGLSQLGAMDSQSRQRGRAQFLRQLLHRVASQPLLLVLEDVHWSAPNEIARLADLAAAVATLPVLLCLTSRPGEDVLAAAWRARGTGCPLTTLDLAPLADDEARELAAAHADLPDEAVERCLETALGHPLFLEQLLRAAHAGQTTLPGTVRGLVLARVERLAPGMQRAVHAAATLGIRFPLEALRHVLADPGFDAEPLEQAGLVAVASDECRFAHALIRDAVYESLLGSTRREFHRRAASWYAERDSGLRAEHLAAADDADAAAAYVRAAGENQRAYRLDRALVYAHRAVDLARQAQDSCDAQATLGDVHLAAGRTSEACTAFRLSIDLASTRASRARAWLGLATALRILDRYDEALVALARAEHELDSSDARQLANLWTLRGNLHFPRGEIDLCLAAHQHALEFARQAGSVEDIARARGGLGDAHYQRGRLRSAEAEFRDCVELSERHGLKGLQLAYLPMLAVTETYTGVLTSAAGTCARAVTAARESGDRRALALALSARASIELYREQYAAALESGERSNALARELGARRFEAETLIQWGMAQHGLHQHAGARATLARAAALAREVCPTYCGPWAYAALALAVVDDRSQVEALLQEGEELLARGCVSHNYFGFHQLGVEVALALGDATRMLRHAAALEDYTRDEPLPWADVVIARGRALAAAAQGAPAADTLRHEALQAARAMQWDALVPALTPAPG